jgi:hypothetical protein
LPLSEAFSNPGVVQEAGIDPILKYLASDRMQEVDTEVVDGVRNFLFGGPGAGGFDLASLNIQRGRDHGLADYNTTRAAYGLPCVATFAQITSDVALQKSLKSLYGSVNNIDLWVGGLAEDHVPGTSVGPLFRTVLVDQFRRLRDGDRYWYEARFSAKQSAGLNRLDLSDVIRRNTGLNNLQRNVFVFDVTLKGSMFEDSNANAVQDPLERPLAKWRVQLLDSAGAILDSAVTTATGVFKFTGLDLGDYRVRAVGAPGWMQTTANPDDVVVTRGMRANGLTFGFTKAVTVPPGYVAPKLPGGDPGFTLDSVAPPPDALDPLRLIDETDPLLRVV